MTGEQFDVLVKLMRGDPESAGCRAARRVLVNNFSQIDAGNETGASRAAVSNAVGRYVDAEKQIRNAWKIGD